MCFAKSPYFVVYTDEFVNDCWVHAEYQNLYGAFFPCDV
jgi:hypothetical protein